MYALGLLDIFPKATADGDHTNSEDRQKDKHRDLAAEGQSRDLGGDFVRLHRFRPQLLGQATVI